MHYTRRRGDPSARNDRGYRSRGQYFVSGRRDRPAAALGGSIVKVCILASSSSGNSTFIATERTRLLVDAGLSRKEIATRLNSIGESEDDLDAILISHEHSDHVSGLLSLARKCGKPIYISRL